MPACRLKISGQARSAAEVAGGRQLAVDPSAKASATPSATTPPQQRHAPPRHQIPRNRRLRGRVPGARRRSGRRASARGHPRAKRAGAAGRNSFDSHWGLRGLGLHPLGHVALAAALAAAVALGRLLRVFRGALGELFLGKKEGLKNQSVSKKTTNLEGADVEELLAAFAPLEVLERRRVVPDACAPNDRERREKRRTHPCRSACRRPCSGAGWSRSRPRPRPGGRT
jgi:hypothetical protein